jgi:hypothetical protein
MLTLLQKDKQGRNIDFAQRTMRRIGGALIAEKKAAIRNERDSNLKKNHMQGLVNIDRTLQLLIIALQIVIF